LIFYKTGFDLRVRGRHLTSGSRYISKLGQ